MTETSLSRRTVLAGAATAGLAMAANAAIPPVANAADQTWDREADVVIVGLGGAGCAAAIEAAGAGAEVLVIDAAEEAGASGSTWINGGEVYLGGTALQAELGVEDSSEAMYECLVRGMGAAGSDEGLKMVCDGAPELYEWLVANGVDFSGEVEWGYIGGGKPGVALSWSGPERQHGYREFVTPAPRAHIAQPEGSGAGFMRPLTAKVDELGVEVLYGTPATALVQDEDGRVVGVCSGQQAFKARKAVILTAGGFTNNLEMIMENWVYATAPAASFVGRGENGDGIRLGQSVGAATQGMADHQLGISMRGFCPAWSYGAMVNAAGRRFIQEDHYNSYIGRALHEQVDAWLICDEPVASVIIDTVMAEPVAVCDTLEELVETVGLPKDATLDTLRFYNESCELGEDREYGKEAEWMQPIEEAPFYAFDRGAEKVYILTMGGLKVDLDARVISRDGEPIAGLYAAGRNANNIFGHYMASGMSVTDCLTFGRIAGRNAAAEEPLA